MFSREAWAVIHSLEFDTARDDDLPALVEAIEAALVRAFMAGRNDALKGKE